MSTVVKAHVARLHYLEALSKQEIAERMGISRFKVARLLDAARAEGIVEIRIADPVPVAGAASRALEAAFGLQLAVVAPEGALARAAAAWVPELAAGAPVGVAWGRTLSEVAAALTPVALGVPVVQICGAIAGLAPGTGPAELALRFAERLGGEPHALPAPALASRAARDALLADPTVAPTVARWAELGLAIVGIGARLPDAPAGAAGHVLVHVFGEDGAMLPSPAAEHAIALDVAGLRRARVMAVAGGAGKHRAVLGALRTGLLDVLVTDERTAAHALEAGR